MNWRKKMKHRIRWLMILMMRYILSIFLYLYIPISLSIWIYLSVFINLFKYLSIYLYLPIYLDESIYISLWKSIQLFLSLWIIKYTYIYISIYWVVLIKVYDRVCNLNKLINYFFGYILFRSNSIQTILILKSFFKINRKKIYNNLIKLFGTFRYL